MARAQPLAASVFLPSGSGAHVLRLRPTSASRPRYVLIWSARADRSGLESSAAAVVRFEGALDQGCEFLSFEVPAAGSSTRKRDRLLPVRATCFRWRAARRVLATYRRRRRDGPPMRRGPRFGARGG